MAPARATLCTVPRSGSRLDASGWIAVGTGAVAVAATLLLPAVAPACSARPGGDVVRPPGAFHAVSAPSRPAMADPVR